MAPSPPPPPRPWKNQRIRGARVAWAPKEYVQRNLNQTEKNFLLDLCRAEVHAEYNLLEILN